MSKSKLHIKTPKLDMNPMVDMAFLLVSFFMLTTTFKTAEPILIEKAHSQSQLKVPETNVMTITVGEEGQVFFTIDGKYVRKKLLRLIGDHYKVEFSDRDQDEFALVSSIGMPIHELDDFLALKPDQRQAIEQIGIPCDTSRNELTDWVILGRIANPRARIAINADKDTPYPLIDRVIQTLLHSKIYRFNLVTELEKIE
jgi:biopolymer transport protein ExbD